MNRKIRLLAVIALMMLSLSVSVLGASATETTNTETEKETESKPKPKPGVAKPKAGWNRSGKYRYYYSKSKRMYTGWKKINGKVYYFWQHDSDDTPKGSAAVGLVKIKNKTYYFSKTGILQTGWVKIKNKNYYFTPKGKYGVLGSAYTGFKVIKNGRYLFQEDGSASVGWKNYKGKKYFFSNSKKLGIRGRALTGWKTISKGRYFFSTHGVMQKNRWISKKYYLGSDGRKLTSTVTPDGYVVNSSGAKVRVAKGWIKTGGHMYYYVSGKKTTGWKTIKGKKYYFDEDGKRLSNTTVDGVYLGSNGVAQSTKPDTDTTPNQNTTPSVLIVAGHGQGDSGAVASYGGQSYREDKYTRQFASLIANKLSAYGSRISVTMYDPDYDMYQVLSGKKNGPKPNLKSYDYILEVHFNATVQASKDPNGDGSCKGIGMYVNSAKKNISIDKAIIQKIHQKTGFKVWGGGTGIMRSSGLFNAKTCQSKGVSYGLLETAFIDDRDDMKFYNKYKDAMAEAAASAIMSSLG